MGNSSHRSTLLGTRAQFSFIFVFVLIFVAGCTDDGGTSSTIDATPFQSASHTPTPQPSGFSQDVLDSTEFRDCFVWLLDNLVTGHEHDFEYSAPTGAMELHYHNNGSGPAGGYYPSTVLRSDTTSVESSVAPTYCQSLMSAE